MVPGNQRCQIISQQESHVGMIVATPQIPPLNSNNLTLLQNIFPVQNYETKIVFFCPQLCVFLVCRSSNKATIPRDQLVVGLSLQQLIGRDKRTLSCFSVSLQTVTCFCPGNISLDNIINLGNLLSSSCHSSFRMKKI